MAKVYSIMAYPKSFPVYAETPEEALAKYRENHPEDKREYTFTGAYNTWVIVEPKDNT